MYTRLMFILLFFCSFSFVQGVTIPIVTVEENDRLEELADETGANEWRFMTNAGLSVSIEAEKMVNFRENSKVTVLVGKGYNGGNALWAGYLLKQKGYHVTAYLLFPSAESPLICQEIISMFKKIGGDVQDFDSTLNSDADLMIDGILGAGVKRGVTGHLAEAIRWANESKRPILSVDIPSGLNGNTGEVGTVAIQAKHTVTFFFPRVGFFIQDGWNHVGTLSIVNLGINSDILSQLNPQAYVVSDTISLYKVSESGQVYQIFDFFEE